MKYFKLSPIRNNLTPPRVVSNRVKILLLVCLIVMVLVMTLAIELDAYQIVYKKLNNNFFSRRIRSPLSILEDLFRQFIESTPEIDQAVSEVVNLNGLEEYLNTIKSKNIKYDTPFMHQGDLWRLIEIESREDGFPKKFVVVYDSVGDSKRITMIATINNARSADKILIFVILPDDILPNGFKQIFKNLIEESNAPRNPAFERIRRLTPWITNQNDQNSTREMIMTTPVIGYLFITNQNVSRNLRLKADNILAVDLKSSLAGFNSDFSLILRNAVEISVNSLKDFGHELGHFFNSFFGSREKTLIEIYLNRNYRDFVDEQTGSTPQAKSEEAFAKLIEAFILASKDWHNYINTDLFRRHSGLKVHFLNLLVELGIAGEEILPENFDMPIDSNANLTLEYFQRLNQYLREKLGL